jgi:hypothetical protein
MNIVKFQQFKNPIVFCFVDNTHTYSSAWACELIKNISDFTISNTFSKGYDIIQGQDEDILLQAAVDFGYKSAVVFSTGTEFINGQSFYNAVEELSKTDIFLAGHILDRKDAYYELHHQCYFINLDAYKIAQQPIIGKQILGVSHRQDAPWRSYENWHDDYTPKTISGGDQVKDYNHKCHGWNILSTAFEKDLPVSVFDESIRNNKKHYYPENQKEFLNHIQWAYKRFNFCSNEFIHTANTEKMNFSQGEFEQCVVPASGDWWVNVVSKTKPVRVIMYDYNQKALDYWKSHVPLLDNVTYDFVKIDLLTEQYDFNNLNFALPTLINLSNIYAYEGTSLFYSLEHRLNKENEMIRAINNKFSNAVINFSLRACTGFTNTPLYNDVTSVEINTLQKPTWHARDWL